MDGRNKFTGKLLKFYSFHYLYRNFYIMPFDRQTAITIGATTAISLLADIVIFSIGASEGGKFQLVIPSGKDAVKLIAAGIVMGITIDWSAKKVEHLFMSEAEKELEAITQTEKNKIRSGERGTSMPVAVTYA